MPRALLVDWGGVMTTSILESLASFCDAEGIAVDVFREAVLGAARRPESPFARIEVGAITPEQFDEEIGALLSETCGRPIAAANLKQRMFAAVKPEPSMAAAVRAARRADIKTALVSNSWGGRDYPFDDFPELFDAVVISGDVGLRKPEPDIYRYAADAVAVLPEECVFVDDFKVNVEGAQAVGMHGVLHRDPDETIRSLEQIFERSLRG